MAWVDCPECDAEMEGGGFGDDAYCRACDRAWETDWDYTDAAEGCMTAWVSTEIKDELALLALRNTPDK